MNFLEYLSHWRNYIDGSFSDYAIRSLLAPFGEAAVQVFLLILLICWFLSSTALMAMCQRLLKIQRYRLLTSSVCSALLIAATCHSLYSKQGLYWYAASVKYSAVVVPLMLFLLLLLHVGSSRRANAGALHTLLAGFLCFISAGFSETFAIALVVGLAVLVVFLRFHEHLWRRCNSLAAAGLMASVISMLIMISAPGVAERVAMHNSEVTNPRLHSTVDYLTETWRILLERLHDPELYTSFALVFAVGLATSLMFAQPQKTYEHEFRALPKYALVLGLAAQLLLFLFLLNYQSDNTDVFGRFSASYTMFLFGHAFVISSLTFMLWKYERAKEMLVGRNIFVPAILLSILFTFLALPLFWSLPGALRTYLWLNSHCLLLFLAWHLHGRPAARDTVNKFALGISCLLAITWMATAIVAAVTLLIAGKDIPRVFTFTAHLVVWQGLAWGVFLGYTLKTFCLRSESRLSLGVISAAGWILALALLASIVAQQLAVLPNFEAFAYDYDERQANIIAQRDEGLREISAAEPLSFNMTWYLRVSKRQSHKCATLYLALNDHEVKWE